MEHVVDADDVEEAVVDVAVDVDEDVRAALPLHFSGHLISLLVLGTSQELVSSKIIFFPRLDWLAD